mgnify:CR=1 FL=1
MRILHFSTRTHNYHPIYIMVGEIVYNLIFKLIIRLILPVLSLEKFTVNEKFICFQVLRVNWALKPPLIFTLRHTEELYYGIRLLRIIASDAL